MKRIFAILIILITTSLHASDGFDSEGHRGARGLKPENTLPAFETALDLGVTTLEMDLHFTADQIVVVWHDPYISPDKCRLEASAEITAPDPATLPPQSTNLLISQLRFEQLQAYRCDQNPEPTRFPDQDNAPTALAGNTYRIVSLAQVFDFVEGYAHNADKDSQQRENALRVQFNIETKRDAANPITINDEFDGVTAGDFELAILEVVDIHGLAERVIIQSFDHRSLYAIRGENETIRLAALTFGTPPPLSTFAEYNITIWSPYYQDLTQRVMTQIRNVEGLADLQIIPWTVNEIAAMQALIDMGVDGIITDRPDLLLSLLSDA